MGLEEERDACHQPEEEYEEGESSLNSSVSSVRTTGTKRKRQLENDEEMGLLREIAQSCSKDDQDGSYVARSLKMLSDDKSRNVAIHEIQTVIFNAQMGNLPGQQILPPTRPNFSELLNMPTNSYY